MKPYYKYLEHTADILFQAEAPTLEELFVQCALATEEGQVDIKKIEPKEKLTFTVENTNEEKLLFDFLDDLVFYKDSEQLIFSKFDIKIEKTDKGFKLTCTAHGEKIDNKKHDPKVDVKAVTMHMFEVKKTDKGWFAKVLLDI
jgi:SHS2 domain-containing protein